MFSTMTSISKSRAVVPVIVWNEAKYRKISIVDALWDSGSVFPDKGIFEVKGLVMNTRLKKHVVIGMDIMKNGQTCIDVVEKEGSKYIRLRFCPDNQLADLSVR